jgi:uncharacterized protein (DUF433 family)
MPPLMEAAMIDWSQCPDVERVPGRLSGQWVVKDTRILARGVIDNAAPEEIASEIYEGIGADRARRIIEYARRHASASCSIRTPRSGCAAFSSAMTSRPPAWDAPPSKTAASSGPPKWPRSQF